MKWLTDECIDGSMNWVEGGIFERQGHGKRGQKKESDSFSSATQITASNTHQGKCNGERY